MRPTAGLRFAMLVLALSSPSEADEIAYRYEGTILPQEAGWEAMGCKPPCYEDIVDGHFVLSWDTGGQLISYYRWISRPGDPPPPSPPFWAEWSFRSDTPFNFRNEGCDAGFDVGYFEIFDLLNLLGDAVVSFSGDDVLANLSLFEFRTFRFESLDGVTFCFGVDGSDFVCGSNGYPKNPGNHFLIITGHGGCDLAEFPTYNEWDFVRYGTIGYGESIVAVDPPGRASGVYLDARVHAPLDRFTVTFDQPNYVYVEEITVEATGGVAPMVTATRRQDNGPPETVEIVLDRPIPYNATTRFIFNDGTIEQTVELAFAPGDTDGDGDADLADFAALQNCFGEPTITGLCQSLDHDDDSLITTFDFVAFYSLFSGQ